MSNRRNFKFTKIKQYAFDGIKRFVTCNNLLTYMDSNKKFKIHTNASKLQLGVVISLKQKPVTLYSRPNIECQIRYAVTEKDMLGIFESLKEFRTW